MNDLKTYLTSFNILTEHELTNALSFFAPLTIKSNSHFLKLGEGIDLHFFLDLTHHVLGITAIVYSYKWLKQEGVSS